MSFCCAAGNCSHLSNSACGGHCIHNNATRTARLMTRAMMVSTVESLRLGAPGHIPEKRAIPTVETIAERMAAFADAGFEGFTIEEMAPFDEETLVRLIGEVKPLVERG